MRKPSDLIDDIRSDSQFGKVTIAQHASAQGIEYWPELRELEFRVELEKGMMEVPGVSRVFFTAPDGKFDWAFYVVPNENSHL